VETKVVEAKVNLFLTIFGTPEARAWFLNILGALSLSMWTAPYSGAEEDHNLLCIIFHDFYASMACLHQELKEYNTAETKMKLESWNASLKTCDQAQIALSEEFRKIMGLSTHLFVNSCGSDPVYKVSAGLNVNSYKAKFPWRTFWHVLYSHNLCLKNWVNPKECENVQSFSSMLKEDWCLLLHHFKIDGEESENPVLEE
jgi:hypothetical protein